MDKKHDNEDVVELNKTIVSLLVLCDRQNHSLHILTMIHDALMSAYSALASNITAETKVLANVMEALTGHLKSTNSQSCDPQVVLNQMSEIAKTVRISADGLGKVVDATNAVLEIAEKNSEWKPSPAIAHIEGISDV